MVNFVKKYMSSHPVVNWIYAITSVVAYLVVLRLVHAGTEYVNITFFGFAGIISLTLMAWFYAWLYGYVKFHSITEKVSVTFITWFFWLGISVGVGLLIEVASSAVMETSVRTSFCIEELLITVLLAPVVEELVYRGVWIELTGIRHPVTSIVFSALLFGTAHGSLVLMVFGSLIGLLLGFVYYRYRNLWLCIAIHSVLNAIPCLVFLL